MKLITVVIIMGLFTTAAHGQEEFKNRWWPNGEPIPCCAASSQSTTTTTVTTPDKTITTTTTIPWPTPPATSSTVQVPANPAPVPPSAPVPPPAPPPVPKAAPPALRQSPQPQQAPIHPKASTNDIYAIVICMYAADPTSKWARADGCRFPENGMTLYRDADECARVADLATRGTTFRSGPGGDTYRRQVKCYKKTVNTWSPI